MDRGPAPLPRVRRLPVRQGLGPGPRKPLPQKHAGRRASVKARLHNRERRRYGFTRRCDSDLELHGSGLGSIPYPRRTRSPFAVRSGSLRKALTPIRIEANRSSGSLSSDLLSHESSRRARRTFWPRRPVRYIAVVHVEFLCALCTNRGAAPTAQFVPLQASAFHVIASESKTTGVGL
jgi:hypothetical protein